METLSSQKGRDSPKVTQGTQGRHRPELRLKNPGSLPYGTTGQARQWGAEDIFTESEREVSKEKEEKEAGGFQGWSPAQPVPGLRGCGNDAAWPAVFQEHHSPNLACGGSQDCRRLRGRKAELMAQADSEGAGVRGGQA